MVVGSWSEREPEWRGMSPADLLLLAAASCSAWDVAGILNKQRQPLVGLEVECRGLRTQEHPRIFTEIHLHYKVYGECSMEKVARAIRLSEDRYCTVVNTLKPSVKITSDFELVSG
jgi:putative redox protein